MKFLFSAILACFSLVLLAQETTPTAESLLLDATREQYKLDNQSREEKWQAIQEEWGRTLSHIEYFTSSNTRYSQEDIDLFQIKVERLIEQAKSSRTEAASTLRTNNLLLEGLGKVPLSSSEPTNLRLTRQQLNKIQRFYQDQVGKLDQLVTNAENLSLALSQLQRAEYTEFIKARVVLPFLPSTIAGALKNVSKKMSDFVLSYRQWLRKHAESTQLWTIRLSVLGIIIAAYFLGKIIRRLFGRNPDVVDPSNSRKLSAAIAESIATGLIPIAIIGLLFVLLNYVFVINSVKFHQVANTLLAHLLVLSLAVTLCLAILSPRYPQWRLTSLSARVSSRVGKGLIALFVVYTADSLVFRFLGIEPKSLVNISNVDSQAISFFGTIFTILEAVGLTYLARPSVWVNTDSSIIDRENTALESMWALCRLLVIAVAVVGVAFSLSGYVYLGGYMVFGIFITIVLFWLC